MQRFLSRSCLFLPLVNLKALYSSNFNCISSSPTSRYINFRRFGSKLYSGGQNNIEISNTNSGAYHLFVGNLPFSFSESDLQNIAVDRGLRDCIGYRIVLNKKTGRSRGFGFIDFDDENSLKKALDALNGVSVEGRELKVDITEGVDSPTKGRRAPTTSKEFSAFVGNLDFSITEDDLEGIVKNRLGDDVVVKARLVRVDGRSRGYGHIDFGSSSDVDEAILSLNGMDLLGRTINVEPARRPTTVAPVRGRSVQDSRDDGDVRGSRDSRDNTFRREPASSSYPSRYSGDRRMDNRGRGPQR